MVVVVEGASGQHGRPPAYAPDSVVSSPDEWLRILLVATKSRGVLRTSTVLFLPTQQIRSIVCMVLPLIWRLTLATSRLSAEYQLLAVL